MKSNGEYMVHSLNPTLNYMRVEKALGRFCVVAADGSGNYTTIDAAVAAAEKRIFVKAGTYVLSATLELDGQVLIGESPVTTKIQLGTNLKITLKTAGATSIYKTGTVTLLKGDATITGAGTAWATGVGNPSTYSDPYILVKGSLLPVKSVDNDTSLEIENSWRSENAAGETYALVDVESAGCYISGFTIEHVQSGVSTSSLIDVSGAGNVIENNRLDCLTNYTTRGIHVGPTGSWAMNTVIRNNTINGANSGIYIGEAQRTIVEGNSVSCSSGYGINLVGTGDIKCKWTSILRNAVDGCNVGIVLNAGSDGSAIIGNTIPTSDSYGIQGAGSNTDIVIRDNVLGGDTRSIEITSGTATRWTIENNFCRKQMRLDCVDTIVAGNYFEAEGLYITGNNNQIVRNRFEGSGWIDGSGDYWQILDNTIDLGGSTGDQIINSNGNGHVVRGNFIYSTVARVGLRVDGDDCIIDGNRIGLSGVALPCIVFDNARDGCVISNNRVWNSGVSYSISTGVGNACTNLSIVGNNVESWGGGIYLEGSGHVVSENVIIGHGGAGAGVNVYGGSDCVVKGNRIYNFALSGVELYDAFDCIVEANVLKTCSPSGVSMSGAAGNCANNTVRGNRVNGTGYGIYLSKGGVGSVIAGNQLTGNSTGINIESQVTDGLMSIEGNVIRSATVRGIRLRNTTNAVGKCVIANNVIVDSADDGILVDDGENVVINGNLVDNAGAEGILTTGSYGTVSNNHVDGATADGIEIDGGDRLVIAGNVALNSGGSQIKNNGTNTSVGNNITS